MSELLRTALVTVLLATLTACTAPRARDVAPEGVALDEERPLRSDGAVVTTRETTCASGLRRAHGRLRACLPGPA